MRRPPRSHSTSSISCLTRTPATMRARSEMLGNALSPNAWRASMSAAARR
jgi:hypothetical protein